MDMDFGVNAGLVEEIYAQWLDNPESVDPSWRTYFEGREGQAGRPTLTDLFRRARAEAKPPAPKGNGNGNGGYDVARTPRASGPVVPVSRAPAEASLQARIHPLLNAYRVRGHLSAHVNPLAEPPARGPDLALENFGLSEADLDTPFPTYDLAGAPRELPLRDIVAWMEETYRRSIGVEFTSIEDPTERAWLQEQMEASRNRHALSPELQRRILTKLSDAEIFEQFIHKSYEAGTKRFSCEGAESLIPLLDLLVDEAADAGVREVVLAMAHRGRLNVLVNIMGMQYREIFAAFEDKEAEKNLGRGDVKYHLGYSGDRRTAKGNDVHLTLCFNPSHLEFVNPVAEGRVRAKQDRLARKTGAPATREVMPLLIHGDAAFIGQGIVAETLNLANLDGYATGGTVHVIVNNQVGFTTLPEESRSTRYASDLVRMLKVPVFHVNGEDPEAVVHTALLAIEWRRRFGKDVVIDMYCYRKYGHNEGDEPRYTQPLMYAAIDKKPTVRQTYVRRLVELGHVTEALADEIVATRRETLAAALGEVKQKGLGTTDYAMGGVWKPYRGGSDADTPEVATGVPAAELVALSQRLLELPEGFSAHPKVLPILRARHDRLVANEPFDWGTGEMLAYATLLSQGTPVRLSGQDVRRGTFSHRHAFLFDSRTGTPYSPLGHVAAKGGRFEAHNSPLSEAGVLGFEFGYSLDYPDALVIWEAQFGDFLNGAQVIVDQFLTSSEDKWRRLSNLVLLLPHGYEGQGPEHSSARLERFLQNAAEDNVQIVNLTTPAQLFHCLRRQVLRPWRKPLVVMSPKSLLRVAATSSGPHRPVSTLDDLVNGRFRRVLPDAGGPSPRDARKVLLCSGKVYFDLCAARDARGAKDVAIVRLEQLYPLNGELDEVLAAFPSGTPLVWVQEEPRNYGGWYYVNAYVRERIGDRLPLSVVAREASASPATGSKAAHVLEQRMLMDAALG